MTTPAAKPLFIVTVHRAERVVGGIQQHIRVFREYCRRVGVPTAVVTPFQAPRWLVYGLFGFRRLLSGSWNARWYHFSHGALARRQLRRQVDRRRQSLIYAQDPISARAALALRRQGWKLRITLVVHFNFSMADEWVGKGHLRAGSAAYRAMLASDDEVLGAVDEIVFVSEYMRIEVNRRLARPDPARQRVVPNAVYPVAAQADPQLVAIRGDLISIGGFEPRKNQQFLLRVLAAARARGQVYTLTLVGDGPLHQSLRRLSEELGISGQVHFTGALSNAAPLIANHRAYVHAARMENLSIVIIEALAAGRPVFAAPVGGTPELFTDGLEGRAWHLSDPSEAAAMLIEVMEDAQRCSEMSAAARARYESCFTPQATQPRLLAAIQGSSPQSITSGPSGSGGEAVSTPRLSVTILTKNEAAMIGRCISSVRWADEIVVLDSGSTDDTVAIAGQHGAVVHSQSWLGWVPQHKRAIELAKNDWVLVLDADEIVTPELAQSIMKVLRGAPDPRDGYVVDRRDELFGKMLPNMRRQSRRLSFVRMFNRLHSHYDPVATIHETILCPGNAHMLEGFLLHWRNVKFTEQCHKYVDNASLEADVLQAQGVNARFHHLLFRPILRFLWCYVWCGGARVGTVGLMQALMRANSEYLRYATLWERQHTTPALHPPPAIWKSSDMPEPPVGFTHQALGG